MRRTYGALAVAAIVLVSAGLRAWAAWQISAPWFAGDEVIYALLGRSLWEHGTLRILGAPTGFLSLVYPAFAGLPLSIGGVAGGYRALRVLQPLVMSLAAVPAYLWARSLGAGRWALAAAALTAAIPSLGYSSFVLTEVVFYPLGLLAVWALAAALERPTRLRQALLVGAVLLAALTRLQAVVLVPVAVTAAVLEALLARSPRRALRLSGAFAAFAALAFLWIAWRAVSGGPWSGLLGGYGGVATGYRAADVGRFVLYHAGGLLLLVGVAPACAVASLFVDACRRGERDDGVRAYLAAAVSLSLWVVLQVGAFASAHAPRFEERYLIVLAPVLFVGLSAWLARGGSRPVMRTAWIAIVALAFVAAFPVKKLMPGDQLGDSFMGLALWREVRPDRFSTVVLVASVLAVALWALLPRRLLVVLPLALLAAFVAVSVSSTREATAQARLQKARLSGPDPRWIDRHADGPVAFLWDGDTYWTAVWESLFFNDRLQEVIDLPHAFVPGPLRQRVARPGPDGSIAGLPRYVVAWDSFTFDGEPVANTQLWGVHHSALVLWKLRSPRMLTRTTGLLPGGDLYGGASAVLTAYGCERGGAAAMTLWAKQPDTVVLSRNGHALRTLQLDEGEVRNVTLRGMPRGGLCTFGIQTSGLLGVTVLEFRRPR